MTADDQAAPADPSGGEARPEHGRRLARSIARTAMSAARRRRIQGDRREHDAHAEQVRRARTTADDNRASTTVDDDDTAAERHAASTPAHGDPQP